MLVNRTYNAFVTAWKGLVLTIKHLFAPNRKREVLPVTSDNYFKKLNEGTNTIQFPKQQLPIPEVGRYQLDVEIDDCIVCDLCAKACPVDCINIESIKASEAIGKTSDGSVKRLYAAKFDIDMAKCMYCGLCTVVCPTECITMTNQYDRSVYQLGELTYQFSEMAPEEVALKKQEFEKQQAERLAAKQAALKAKEGGA
ncbi:4Fe-4S dicluster domain-containing protein [Mucilaginibacter robiniae]|uniref:4Fe-4S dicluster domain-containing protein n=1 Tax=Mucilaginibacter robiniae TaxID=2728022 RepID=A0A7L5DXD7_9SPHI|nr:4Fe-4S dicluster domain-containing protein [Mucilaginibacter robiniae]